MDADIVAQRGPTIMFANKSQLNETAHGEKLACAVLMDDDHSRRVPWYLFAISKDGRLVLYSGIGSSVIERTAGHALVVHKEESSPSAQEVDMREVAEGKPSVAQESESPKDGGGFEWLL